MQLYKIGNLWFVVSLIILACVIMLSSKMKKKRIVSFGVASTYAQLTKTHSSSFYTIRIILYFLIAIVTIIALCRPQWGEEKKRLHRKGVDILFVLDTSNSMAAGDIYPNRFQKAKNQIMRIVQMIKSDRIGIVAFAAQSYLACPLTLDYSAFKLFLGSIDIGYIPIQGTSLYNALQTAVTSFIDSDGTYNVIIIFSDGEDHVGGMQEIIKKMKSLGVRIYCVGLGTAQGSPMPSMDHTGSFNKKYVVDSDGEIVITRLQNLNLKHLADVTGGLYYQATDTDNEISLIIEHIRQLETKEFKDVHIIEREDRFQLFLLVIFFLLMIEYLLPERKKAL